MLVGFLPDRALIREGNTVEVVWVGNEGLKRTAELLAFGAEDIGGDR